MNTMLHNKDAFHCSRCGACCSHLKVFGDIYQNLDRGDGVCRHYDIMTKRCLIYEIRPNLCNVSKGFAIFSDHMSWNEYIKKTKKSCIYLQSLK